jgi:hypothetical protein
MTRRSFARSAAAIGSLALLSACIVNLSFEMKKTFAVQSDPTVPTSVAQNQLIDLSQYAEVAAHKDQIKSLDLDYADATVTAIGPGNKATRLSGSLKLRLSLSDKDHDIKVGDLSNVAVALGSTVRINGTPEIDAFLFQQLQAQGKFYAVIEGSVDGQADLALDVNLHASIGYETGGL